MAAAKFFVAAKLLGPDAIGIVTIALLTLAVVEALSEMGLQQAIVQSHRELTVGQGGAIWTLQLSRGVVTSLVLIGAATSIASALKAPEAAPLVILAATIAISRNSLNPGVILQQRRRNFRNLALYDAGSGAIDVVVTFIFIACGAGAVALIAGTVAGELCKLAISWTVFRAKIRPNFRWHRVSHLTRYGRWIWANSILALLLNQLDKVLVARFLGVGELGLYQLAAKVAQLAVADPINAASQYLFPTYAKLFRQDPNAAKMRFVRLSRLCLLGATVVAFFLAILAGPLVHFVLGDSWAGAVGLIQLFALPMLAGASIGLVVPYLRAIGRPRVIAVACLLQLGLLGAVGPWLAQRHGTVGMVMALFVAGMGSLIYMYTVAHKSGNEK